MSNQTLLVSLKTRLNLENNVIFNLNWITAIPVVPNNVFSKLFQRSIKRYDVTKIQRWKGVVCRLGVELMWIRYNFICNSAKIWLLLLFRVFNQNIVLLNIRNRILAGIKYVSRIVNQGDCYQKSSSKSIALFTRPLGNRGLSFFRYAFKWMMHA